VLERYERRQLTSAEVVERLVELAKRVRDARHRHEELGLSEEEAAFYDALAGGAEHVKADPGLAVIAHELVESIRGDLTVDWADREAGEARIRTKIRRLLRRHRDKLALDPEDAGSASGAPAGRARDIDFYTEAVFGQARTLYRYWPGVGGRLFEEVGR